MNKHSKLLLIIQVIAMYVAMAPSFIGFLLSGSSSEFATLMKDPAMFVIPFMLLNAFAFVSIIFSFIPSKGKVESPILVSAIVEAASCVWGVGTFLLFINSIASMGEGSGSSGGEGLAIAIVVIFLAILSVALIVPACVFMTFPARIHAITYTIRNIRNGTFESNWLVITGTIILFIIPVAGQILIYIYEESNKHSKNTETIEAEIE